MILKYKKRDGTQMEFELGDRPITIGRGAEADLVILDEKASRLHCGIRVWDGDVLLKDLKSKNGTFVNGERVEMALLATGDRVRVGNCVFSLESDPSKGTETILREVIDEMDKGKGYGTILKEIVEPLESAAAPAPPPVPHDPPHAMPPPPPTIAAPPPADGARMTIKTAPRRVMKIRVKPQDGA